MDQIHDLHGVRLIVETKEDCYLALELINELWPRVVKLKDYITNPKPNGYLNIRLLILQILQCSTFVEVTLGLSIAATENA